MRQQKQQLLLLHQQRSEVAGSLVRSWVAFHQLHSRRQLIVVQQLQQPQQPQQQLLLLLNLCLTLYLIF
jgi:hypothetical protein